MPIKSPDKLIPAGSFKLADLSDIDISVQTNVTSGSYDPGASPTHHAKFLITFAPGFEGANLHANFKNNLSTNATNNLEINDILEWDDINDEYTLK